MVGNHNSMNTMVPYMYILAKWMLICFIPCLQPMKMQNLGGRTILLHIDTGVFHEKLIGGGKGRKTLSRDVVSNSLSQYSQTQGGISIKK